jgi:hypothetical protein
MRRDRVSICDRAVQWYLWSRQHGRWLYEVTGRDPSEDDEWIDRHEPIHRAAEAVPTMLLHGDADIDVPVGESRKLAAALDSAGIDHSCLEFPGAGHGFEVPDTDEIFDPVLDFLGHHRGSGPAGERPTRPLAQPIPEATSGKGTSVRLPDQHPTGTSSSHATKTIFPKPLRSRRGGMATTCQAGTVSEAQPEPCGNCGTPVVDGWTVIIGPKEGARLTEDQVCLQCGTRFWYDHDPDTP